MSNECSSRSAATEDYLYSRINYERRSDDPNEDWDFRFETILQLLNRRGNPHLRYPIIHVAGTKGKGSVVSMVAGILAAAGYRTGVYSSPHLENLRERIVVAREQIPSADFSQLIESFRPDIAEIDRQSGERNELHPPTFFEVMTAAAFDYFALREVDAAVIEVGMGGRLDSTNVCRPIATVITNIGLDHQRLLGATRSLIAAEKAGIIKPEIPLICGVQQYKSAQVIAEIANRNRAPTFWLGQDFRCRVARRVPQRDDPTEFHTWGNVGGEYELLNCRTNLIGRHQAVNASIAIAVAKCLVHLGWNVDSSAIRLGLQDISISGRFQVFDGQPRIVLDIAHNELSVSAFVRTLNERFGSDSRGRVLIFSASRDKKISRMLSHLLPHFERVILAKIVGNPRGCEVAVLKSLAEKQLARWSNPNRTIPKLSTAANSQEAWEMVLQSSDPCHSVAVTGSAFLVGEMLPVIRNWRSLPVSRVEQVPAID